MNADERDQDAPYDWKAEARGLGYMIRQIAAHYRQAKAMGDDSELLASSVMQSAAYVEGPLRELLDAENPRAPESPKEATQ